MRLAERVVEASTVDGVVYLRSPQALGAGFPTLVEAFRASVAREPGRDFLIERTAGGLRRVSWEQAWERAEGIASWLVGEGHTCVAALSGNSVDHALVMLGCFLAGVPFVPVSPAYSLLTSDFDKLGAVLDKAKPTALFAERQDFKSLEWARGRTGAVTTIGSAPPRQLPEVTPDHVAKILFTSGSTGSPKGVPNTHRMLCANQQMIAQCWPFLDESSFVPILVDWLPWSHTFGGNHDFNMALAHAGTVFVDEGRPTSIDASLRNLREVPPTLYFNVPAGYAALVPRLEADAELARAFFSRLRVMFYAAAALPPDLWARLVALASAHAPSPVFMTTAWGSTETSPLATSAHFPLEGAGNIGLPAPGVTLKLVPEGGKLEVRVRGASVMAGYLDEPELTAQAFDEEGFYRMGDAVKLADPSDPSAGLVFDGRLKEDFKLSSGTWVSVTHVRTGLVAAAGGALADVIVCGHDRDYLAVLAWPSVAECQRLAGPLPMHDLAAAHAVRERVKEALARYNRDHAASSTRVMRVLLLREPPSIDAGEITDKGYTNQRATRERRARDVDELFADPRSPRVIVG